MNIYHIELPDWFTAAFVEKLVMRVAILYWLELRGRDLSKITDLLAIPIGFLAIKALQGKVKAKKRHLKCLRLLTLSLNR